MTRMIKWLNTGDRITGMGLDDSSGDALGHGVAGGTPLRAGANGVHAQDLRIRVSTPEGEDPMYHRLMRPEPKHEWNYNATCIHCGAKGLAALVFCPVEDPQLRQRNHLAFHLEG